MTNEYNSVEEAVREGIQGIVDIGIQPKSFTKKELKELGVILPQEIVIEKEE